jgi:hypothetical protein
MVLWSEEQERRPKGNQDGSYPGTGRGSDARCDYPLGRPAPPPECLRHEVKMLTALLTALFALCCCESFYHKREVY